MATFGREGGDDASGPYRSARGGVGRVRCAPRRGRHGLRGSAFEDRGCSLALALKRLEREHAALLAAIGELEAAPGPEQDDEDADERAVRDALRQLLRDDLRQTQHALARAARGEYGRCEECRRPLSRRHLEAHPAETRCSLCEARLPVSRWN